MAKKAAALTAFQASDPDLPQLAIPPTILEEVQDTTRGDSRKIESRGGGDEAKGGGRGNDGGAETELIRSRSGQALDSF